MKLSEILSNLHHSGDVGKAVEGLAELAGALEQLVTSHKDEVAKLRDTFNSRISEVTTERDALAAKLEAAKMLVAVHERNIPNLIGSTKSDDDKFYLPFKVACEAVADVQDQLKDNKFLNKIRAEAGRAGYFRGHRDASVINYEWSVKHSERHADEYATKIRNTGTWLKDSNVNGGKRQGGE